MEEQTLLVTDSTDEQLTAEPTEVAIPAASAPVDADDLPDLRELPKIEVPAVPTEVYRWYSLRVISGKERKIVERIQKEIELSNWHGYINQMVVPVEKVYKIRNGKKVALERNILPGYILVEALPSKLKGEVVKAIHDLTNVIHFLGKENPTPMSFVDANRLLGKFDEKNAAIEKMIEPFIIGETVKIMDGPFIEFIGDVQEVNEEKKKLKVIVKIFGRGTEVELSFMQVEKIV